ncbi:Hypothetical protein BROD_0096 [Brucella sp. NF 2653]|nr:Hypothetical protein BROD_0096 [Brucella sp. NF 2653]
MKKFVLAAAALALSAGAALAETRMLANLPIFMRTTAPRLLPRSSTIRLRLRSRLRFIRTVRLIVSAMPRLQTKAF